MKGSATPYAAFLDNGFSETETGGGCTALAIYYPDGTYWLVTEERDPSAPTEDTPLWDTVRLGFYRGIESDPEFTCACPFTFAPMIWFRVQNDREV